MPVRLDPALIAVGRSGTDAEIKTALEAVTRKRHGLANLWEGARQRENQGGGHERLFGLGQKRLIAELALAQKPLPAAPLYVLQDIMRFAGHIGNQQIFALACIRAGERPALIPALIQGARHNDHHTRCMPENSRYLKACKEIMAALPFVRTAVKPPYTDMIRRLADEIRGPNDFGILAAATNRFHHDPAFWTIIKNATDYICMREIDYMSLRMGMMTSVAPAPARSKNNGRPSL